MSVWSRTLADCCSVFYISSDPCFIISSRRRTASSFTSALSALDSRFSFRARAKHSTDGHRYAPLPAIFPVGSTVTSPAGVLTTRSRARLSLVVLHATQVLIGVLRCLIGISRKAFSTRSINQFTFCPNDFFGRFRHLGRAIVNISHCSVLIFGTR